MCRHLAWLGAPRTLADLVLEQPAGLLQQSYAPQRQLRGVVNADGWGVGFHAEDRPGGHGEPVRWRSARPLWGEASFASVAPQLRSGSVVAAVRSASVGMPMEESAAAPFTDGRRLLSHNGRLDRTVLPPTHAAESTCDSAVLAAYVFGCLDAGEQLADVVADVAGRDPTASLNLLVLERDRLTAVSWVDRMSYLHTEHGLAVASEAYDDDPRWVDLSTHHLLEAVRDAHADGGVRVTTRPLTPSPEDP
ncbi:ergothioneine biosynthesis protein EgtC [Nocardioidaceae bacterium]|nr:ergothioneine biosynthesis protein EgtC [Nocardioidaceae bacterium]